MIDMWTRLTSSECLMDAWSKVRASAQTSDGLPGAFRRFERDQDNRIEHLRRALTQGWYRPRNLSAHRIPKDDGTWRVLHVPSLDDRVVERALLDELTPIIDPTLSDAAHAYRPGRGVHSAIRSVVRLRAGGFSSVAVADVDDCFASIAPSRVREALASYSIPDEVRCIIDRLLFRRALVRRPDDVLRGLPQGSPLSPLFMNTVLGPFDEALLAQGIALTRYADDLVMATVDLKSAADTLEIAKNELHRLDLCMGEEKTFVTDFEHGFSFLGEDFGPTLPVDDDAEADPDSPRSVFVGLQGARVSAVRGRLLVETPDDVERLNLPLGRVGRLVLAGSVSLSAGARSWALLNDVPATFLSRNGSMLGTLEPAVSPGRRLRLACQIAFVADVGRTTPVAQAVVRGKIRKQRIVLQRMARGRCCPGAVAALDLMKALADRTPTAGTTAELMGYEGAAARAYFSALGELMPEHLSFTERSRRPPRDLVNAALSYGYAILLGEATSALNVVGLDPAFGILHRDEVDRESLALDLIEEFRPWVVDSAVTRLVRKRELRAEHADIQLGREGVWLSADGKAKLIEAYEERMLAKSSGAIPGFTGSVRRCLYRQAHRLALHIQAPEEHPYSECSWR